MPAPYLSDVDASGLQACGSLSLFLVILPLTFVAELNLVDSVHVKRDKHFDTMRQLNTHMLHPLSVSSASLLSTPRGAQLQGHRTFLLS